MSQEEFGKLIKRIRQENNLTQKDLAEKYNVTYQAVSKWENGKNMPDIALIKQISNDFNISVDNMIEGKYKTQDNKAIIAIILGAIVLVLIAFILVRNTGSFEFKQITSNCDDFNISGSMSYDNNKSVIYISNITYCGTKDDEIYKSIKCSLFDKHEDVIKEISSCEEKENITLDDFLKDTTFHLDNTKNSCRTYSEDHLYLEIYATKDNGQTVLYEVPLKVSEVCQ